MPDLTDLITDLSVATEQMQQAASGDDWAMVEKIQKRRTVLIARLIEDARTVALTEEDTDRLSAVRAQEAFITSRAAARQQALGKMLMETQTVTSTEKPSRMQKAYGILDR